MSDPLTIETVAGPAILFRSERTTLALSVCPDGGLELKAPRNASLGSIRDKVEARLPWIVRQRVRFKQLQRDRVPLRYEAGATHTYLGRQYRLKLTEAHEAAVSLKGAYIHIASPTRSPERVRALLEGWFRERAKVQFSARVEKWKPWCEARGLPAPTARLLKMSKRWGSSHRDGRILLNPDLVKAPAICVDYVIAHEVCHLKHPDHGRAFLRLMGQVFPDWRRVRSVLDRLDNL